jgi:transcriptional regulator with XRE-family HTH domain
MKQANPNSDLAQFVKAARIAMGKTQQELAAIFNLTKANVSSWENGRHEPSYRVLVALSSYSSIPLPHSISTDIPDIQEKHLSIPDVPTEQVLDSFIRTLRRQNPDTRDVLLKPLAVLVQAPDSAEARARVLAVLEHS